MSADCKSYYNAEKEFVDRFSCPKPDTDARSIFCCGFNDVKYCCDDPNSFFPYEFGYMWWLSLGALVGLSIAAAVLLAFIVTICVLCYLFIASKPRDLDNGLPLRVPELLSVTETVELAQYTPVEDKKNTLNTIRQKQQKGDNEPSPQQALSQPSAPVGPQGFRKHFLRGKLDCDKQPSDPDRLFQRCLMNNVIIINVEGPS